MAHAKRIAIIGAGPSGLTAIKCCKEEGFSPVCYERNSNPGGLWRYHEEDLEGVASVMKTTILNTSKEISTFSDFPPPREFPNYMHNSKVFDYFMSYAEHFDLLRHIRYNFTVIKVEPAKYYDETGRWTVTARSTETATATKEDFDGVLVCVGHHVYPKTPTFPDQDKFKGSIVHTHSLKNCECYAGQRVVVVGIGNSGVDAAVDCTFVAKQVYLSTRRGSWIFQRVGINGRPQDIDMISRKNMFLRRCVPFGLLCDIIEKETNAKFDHAAYNLRPKHRILSAHPTTSDSLPNCILSGKIIIKSNIERFVENGVVFDGEDRATEADAVILATGYDIKFPFIDSQILASEDNRFGMYKYAFPPNIRHPTLAFIGLVQPIGSIFNVSEMQCRLFMQVFSGKVKLPSVEEMERDIVCKNEANAKRYVTSTTEEEDTESSFRNFEASLSSGKGTKPIIH